MIGARPYRRVEPATRIGDRPFGAACLLINERPGTPDSAGLLDAAVLRFDVARSRVDRPLPTALASDPAVAEAVPPVVLGHPDDETVSLVRQDDGVALVGRTCDLEAGWSPCRKRSGGAAIALVFGSLVAGLVRPAVLDRIRPVALLDYRIRPVVAASDDANAHRDQQGRYGCKRACASHGRSTLTVAGWFLRWPKLNAGSCQPVPLPTG